MSSVVRIGLVALLIPLVGFDAAAQVSIGPLIVLLTEGNRIGDFTVGNNSDRIQEVTIDFQFGYMRSDTLGNLAMEYRDSASAARFSMTEWVTAFPRRFLLRPGTEQTVRIMARPPRDLAPGSYWTRLITASVPQSAPVDSIRAGVTAQIAVRLEQVTTVVYRRGEVVSGVSLGTLALHRDSAGTHLLIPLSARDVSPFLGTSTVSIRDERGTLAHEMRAPVAVYFQQVQRISLPRSLDNRNYRVEVSVQPGRDDVPGWVPRAVRPVIAALQLSLR